MPARKNTVRIELGLPTDPEFHKVLSKLVANDGKIRKAFLEDLVIQHVKNNGWKPKQPKAHA